MTDTTAQDIDVMAAEFVRAYGAHMKSPDSNFSQALFISDMPPERINAFLSRVAELIPGLTITLGEGSPVEGFSVRPGQYEYPVMSVTYQP